jgi:inorganic pyrophosphatase
MSIARVLAVVALPCALAAQAAATPPDLLPSTAVTRLRQSLDAATRHRNHVWRDTAPVNADGTVNAYVEIPRGERRKWEFDMAANERAVDRVMPDDLAYPVNYGFVPQTISYDGDPFDALVLGRPLPGGRVVSGIIVGLMLMDDEKGYDAKVVLSPQGPEGQPLHALTAAEQRRIGSYFERYKKHEPGAFSKVPGWGTIADGRAHIHRTHTFFAQCRSASGACRPPTP